MWPGAARPLEDVADLGSSTGHGGEDQRRVEVALHGLAGLDAARRGVERHPPVDAHDLGAGRRSWRPSSSPVATPKWIRGTPRSATPPRTVARVGQHEPSVVARRQPAGPRVEELDRATPGLGLRPGGTPAEISASRSISASQTSGSPCISALVLAWSRHGPPSMRYDARVNGAPANPISGVPPSSPRQPLHRLGDEAEPRRASSGRDRPGRRGRGSAAAITGPTPGTMSRSTPSALSGSTMSEKKMAASTPCRRTGCSVISTIRSGRMQASSIGDALAELAVLGQRAAGLAHEPDRQPVRTVASGSADQRARARIGGVHERNPRTKQSGAS